MTGRSPQLQLTDIEFDACWELLGLGERPAALELTSPGRNTGERRHIIAGVIDRLRGRGLAGPDGLCEPLARALRLLAHPDYRLDIRHHSPTGDVIGLGAVAGSAGVRVTQRARRLSILRLDSILVLPALIELAGPLTPGTGRTVNLPAEDLDSALATNPATASALADDLIRRGVGRADAGSVAHMCRGVRAGGQIGATAYGPAGPRRAPWVVGYHQARSGHFLQLRRPEPHGRAVSVTLAPLTAERLFSYTSELARAVTPARTERNRGRVPLNAVFR